jgi:hypothetical protein
VSAVPERPKPDMDHTREALRRHDERVESEEPEETEDAEPDESEEQKPDSP